MIHVVPGVPAEFDERIVARRARIVAGYPGFAGRELTLVDAGCGNGASMLALTGSFQRCHGIDISEPFLQAFRQEAARRGIGNCTASAGDLCKGRFSDEVFDRLISFEVIEHLPNEQEGVRTMHRLLKPGGLFAITVPNKWWIFETHGAYLPLLPWHRVPLFSWLPRRIHERFSKARIYTRARIVALLVQAGFRVRHVCYVTAPMDRLTNPILQKIATSTIFRRDTTRVPLLATSVMVLGDKPE
jgi:2-polyprenyl-3-methyl-5-hydroxy-6-metoxy-1,4-benzoquinol methylase